MTTETQATIEGLKKEIETCEFTFISIHKDEAKSILSLLTKQANELDKLAKENEELKSLFIETAMRNRIALPENETQEIWFEEGLNVKKSGDYMIRLLTKLNDLKVDL